MAMGWGTAYTLPRCANAKHWRPHHIHISSSHHGAHIAAYTQTDTDSTTGRAVS